MCVSTQLAAFFFLSFISFAWSTTAYSGSEVFRLNLSDDGLNYGVVIDNVQWLQGSPISTFVSGTWLVAGKNLHLESRNSWTSVDYLGAFNATAFLWTSNVTTYPNKFSFSTVFKQYEKAIFFEQSFPFGVAGCSLNDADIPQTHFPSFRIDSSNFLAKLSYLTYHSTFAVPLSGVGLDGFVGGGLNGGPVILFDNPEKRSVVLSSASHFMDAVQSVVSAESTKLLACGLHGNFSSLPMGLVHSSVLYIGEGINDAFENWGSLLQHIFSTNHITANDRALNYLGYWTDNGAVYYGCLYNTGNEGYDYQKLLQSLKQYYHANSIPVRYWQLDAWWYRSSGIVDDNYCIEDFAPRANYFPEGLDYLRTSLNGSLHIYTNYYCHNNSLRSSFMMTDSVAFAFPWVNSKKTVLSQPLPEVSQQFYEHIFGTVASQWSMFNVELDYMIQNYMNFPYFRSNLGSSRQWLSSMGMAASKFDISLTYCMSLPRHFMQTLEIPAVNTIRVSSDFATSNNWMIGPRALFAHSLGLAPFKDTFWTMGNQHANPNHRTLSDSDCSLNALVAAFSGGPVGISDGLNATNATLVHRLCTTEGRLLRPSRPLTSIDATFSGSKAPTGIIYVANSILLGYSGRWHYILVANLTQEYVLAPSALPQHHADRNITYMVRNGDDVNFCFSANMSCAVPFDHRHPLVLQTLRKSQGSIPYRWFVAAPVLPNSWTLLGEIDKFVAVSPVRFESISAPFGCPNVTVVVRGYPGEHVKIVFLRPDSSAKQAVVVSETIPAGGYSTLTVS